MSSDSRYCELEDFLIHLQLSQSCAGLKCTVFRHVTANMRRPIPRYRESCRPQFVCDDLNAAQAQNAWYATRLQRKSCDAESRLCETEEERD